jgi:hypothetical protein
MKKAVSIILFLIVVTGAAAQDSTAAIINAGVVAVIKDPRLDLLAKKEMEFNTLGIKAAKGFRLLVMSSNDREKVMSVRAKLLQQFPEQKVYMTFQAPYIKLKFGNFVEKPEAERYRDLLSKVHIVSTNVYVVPEVVEVKADKIREKEDE